MSTSSAPTLWNVYATNYTTAPREEDLIGQFQTCADAMASIPEAQHYLYPDDKTRHTTTPTPRPLHLIRNDIPPHLRGPGNSIVIGQEYYVNDMRSVYRAMKKNTSPCMYLYVQYNNSKDPTLVTYVWHHLLSSTFDLHMSFTQIYRIHADAHMVRLDAYDDMVCQIQAESIRLMLSTRSEPITTLRNATPTTLIDAIQQHLDKRSSLSAHQKMSLHRQLPGLIAPNIHDIIRPSYIVE